MLKRVLSVFLIFTILLCGCGRVSSEAGAVSEAVDDNYRNYYEIFVRSFYDSDGDGIGDLRGVTEKLDYIADLGCNGIWLMPICPSDTYHKYDVLDYCDIDDEYGSPEDFDELVAECHARDIRLIIDLVINHTSSGHPWFIEATDYIKSLGDDETMDVSVCPYVDYYHFTKEDKGAGWEKVAGTDYYYECNFWSEMPDLNLANPAVKEEIEHIADYWIDKGVDGFRMDAALHFEEGDTDFNASTLAWLYDYCKAKNPDFYMVSEVWADKSTIASYYESETPSMFNFALADAEGDICKAARGKESASKLVDRMIECDDLYSDTYVSYIDAPFITNHDMGRAANALQSDETSVKMAAAILLSMSGSPFIYYGEEIGAKSKGKLDENKRLHMNWSSKDMTGITEDPQNADQNIEQVFPSVEEQIIDSESIFNFYRTALHLRNQYQEIARGEIQRYSGITTDSDDQAVVVKTWNDSTLYIAYNTADSEAKLTLDGKYEIVGQLNAAGGKSKVSGGKLKMAPRSVVYMKKK